MALFATSRRPARSAGLDKKRTTEIGRELLGGARQCPRAVLRPLLVRSVDELGHEGPGLQGAVVPLRRRLSHAPHARAGARLPGRLSRPAGRDAAAGHGTGPEGRRAGQGADGQDHRRTASRAMAGNFIAGADAASALPTLQKLWNEGIAFSVDLLGEACVSDEEAARLSAALSRPDRDPARRRSRQWPANPRLETDHLGPDPADQRLDQDQLALRADRSDRLRGLAPRAGRGAAADPRSGRAAQRAGQLRHGAVRPEGPDAGRCSSAAARQIDFPAGLAMQAYLRSGEDDAERIIAWAQRHRPAGDRAADQGRLLGLRSDPRRADGLARAGLDRQARRPTPASSGWPSTSSRPCRGSRAKGGVKLAIGSHNVRSIAYALALLEQHDLPDVGRRSRRCSTAWPISCKAALVGRGLRLREYVPVGRDDPRHGLPRAAAAGEHVEPIVAAGGLLRGRAGRRAAGVAAR